MLRKLMCRSIVKQFSRKENPSSVLNNCTDTTTTITTIFKRPNSSKFDLFTTKTGRKVYYDEKTKKKIGAFEIFMLGIPVTTFALGTWQVQRLKWKLNLIEGLKQRSSGEPIELPNNLEELEDKEYYPVKVKGHFLYDKEFIIGPKSLIVDGAAASSQSKLFNQKSGTGYYIVTPFQLEDRDMIILVNRGWVPPDMRDPSKRQSSQIHGTVEITGLVRSSEIRPSFIPAHKPTDKEWLYRDIEGMAEIIGAAPVYLDMVTKFDSPNAPISGQTHINIRNEHLSYILTWYILSVFTAWMWYTKFVKKMPIL